MNTTVTSLPIPDAAIKTIREQRLKSMSLGQSSQTTTPTEWRHSGENPTTFFAFTQRAVAKPRRDPRLAQFVTLAIIRHAMLDNENEFSRPMVLEGEDHGLSGLIAKKVADGMIEAFLRENAQIAEERDESGFGWSARRARIRRAIKRFCAE